MLRAVRIWASRQRDGAPARRRLDRIHDEVEERLGQFVGIGVELGVWTSGDAVTLRRSRVPRGTTRVLAESTVSDPSTAVAEGVRIMRALGSDLGVPVLLHGEEGGAWPVLEYAMGLNIDTRIGFEDVLVLPDGWLATGNDNLVSKALEIGSGKRAWGLQHRMRSRRAR